MIAPALEALKAHRQFILYRLSPSQTRPGKTDKVPCDASGRVVSAHDPAHWMTATGAASLVQQFGNGWGIGFVLTPDARRFCLDIDNCLQPDDQWSPLALQLCAMFPGAAIEVSQSGCGLHIWGSYTGDMPLHGCKNEALGIELYTDKRFIALGRPEGTTGNVATDCTMAVHSAIAIYFPPDAAQALAQEWTTAPCAEWAGPSDDDELIRRASRAQSTASAFGGKATFADLWAGNAEALGRSYPDPVRPYDASQADAALAQRLAFWTGKSCERIERLMRQSALARDKWDSHSSYLSRTILKAVGRQEEVLTDKAPAPLPLAMAAPAGAVALQGVEMTMLQAGTQDSVAMIFARQMAGKLLYNHTRGKWLEWDGARWRIEATKKALNFARDLARSVNYEGSRSIGSASFCAGVEMLALADPALSAVGDEFDRDNYILNTPGGTFNLRTNEGRQHNPDDRLSLCTTVAPTREGGAAFDKFLDEITLGDRELAEFLQVSLGACLSGAVESHWLLFWTGTGRNGKNTLGELVRDAMGDYARKVPTSVLMAKKHEGHPTEIANLQGIRLALSSEINDGEHWHEARLNEVTGDGTLSGRFMGRDLFEFKRTHKHLIYGNHRPQLRAVTPALRSRIKIVPFKASFLGREDGDLPRRLRENLGYVLAWLIEGHSKWLAAGKRLPPCQAVEAESAEYFAAQSTPEMWLAERVQILAPDERNVLALPQAGALYRDYSEWKKDRGEQPVSMARWAETLKRFEKVRSSGVRYRGLMLIPQIGNVPFPLVA